MQPKMLEIKPSPAIEAVIECPKSKGLTNRALVVAALANGTSELVNALISDDTLRMMEGLRSFGAAVQVFGSRAVVQGFDGKPKTPKKKIFVGNSGTTARFLTALAAIDGTALIDGDTRMKERPIKDLANALNSLGVAVKTSNGCPPVKVFGGKLSGGTISVSGKTSSQFISALLMISPYADNDMTIRISGGLTSKPFVDITLKVMEDFGAEVSRKGYKEFKVASGYSYRARSYVVEGDTANASYFFAAAAVTGGKVRVKGISPVSQQGEIKFVDLLERMGCLVGKGKDWIEVKGGRLKGITADMNSMPDAVQTLAVVAAFANSPTTIKNVPNLRIKETDRIKALANELRKLGARVKELKGGLRIIPTKELRGTDIDTYNDHRMAMSFAIAGLKIKGVRIKNPDCVNKTFPDFFKQLKRLTA